MRRKRILGLLTCKRKRRLFGNKKVTNKIKENFFEYLTNTQIFCHGNKYSNILSQWVCMVIMMGLFINNSPKKHYLRTHTTIHLSKYIGENLTHTGVRFKSTGLGRSRKLTKNCQMRVLGVHAKFLQQLAGTHVAIRALIAHNQN